MPNCSHCVSSAAALRGPCAVAAWGNAGASADIGPTSRIARLATPRAGRPVSLTAKEYALLEFLMLNENRVVGREQIAQHVWDESFDAFSNVIDVYIKRLRVKLDTGGRKRMIRTRRGEGYMLTAEAEAADD